MIPEQTQLRTELACYEEQISKLQKKILKKKKEVEEVNKLYEKLEKGEYSIVDFNPTGSIHVKIDGTIYRILPGDGRFWLQIPSKVMTVDTCNDNDFTNKVLSLMTEKYEQEGCNFEEAYANKVATEDAVKKYNETHINQI